ncbi:MAG: polysaccharide deacetylase family protein, partial [Clostridia bacterium]
MAVAIVASIPQNAAVTETSAIYSGNKNGDSVCLMFNVYQNTKEVEQIAEIFSQYGFKTTFFVGGSWANRNGDTVIKLVSNGFEIGNHGYLHRDHASLSLKANIDEITQTEKILEATLKDLNLSTEAPASSAFEINNTKKQIINGNNNNYLNYNKNTVENATPNYQTAKQFSNTDSNNGFLSYNQNTVGNATPNYQTAKLFAPPSGSIGNDMFKACEQLNYKVIMWTRDTIDWRDQDANVIYNRAIKNI